MAANSPLTWEPHPSSLFLHPSSWVGVTILVPDATRRLTGGVFMVENYQDGVCLQGDSHRGPGCAQRFA